MPVLFRVLKYCFKSNRVFVLKNEGSKRVLHLAAMRGLRWFKNPPPSSAFGSRHLLQRMTKKQGSKRVQIHTAMRD